ncbi:MAG: radical SAM protein [Lentisphaerae bacterium RIFOXYB12_FULL_65_16]|nr:MAG: radical SAM protein [Lentisphaerae bacterium RIFOXYA12_64_32]OGV91274.1 MAG: radical SAM protein [Lentisphaerae bacterium RIFOXYB12_FULL_65_16]
MGNVYTKMKIFHFPAKLDSLPADQPLTAPLHIRIKPTNRCSHNCWYCAYRRENIQLGKDMVSKDQIPPDKMAEIVEDCAEMGVLAVTFSGGGEPLCYPHLLGTLRRLHACGVRYGSLTNGARLHGEIAEEFAAHGTWVRVSLDGWDGPSYARYRGVSEREFDKVMTNIADFKRLGGACYLGVVIIVDKDNASHVYELIRRMHDLGVRSVKAAPCFISDDAVENNTYHRPLMSMVRTQIEQAKSEMAGVNFEIFDSYQEQLTTFDKGYDWCPYIQINPVIGADLNVYSCHDKAYNLDSGFLFSIKDRRFKDAWLADKAQFFTINPGRDCRHHCVVHEKNKLIWEYLHADRTHIVFV